MCEQHLCRNIIFEKISCRWPVTWLFIKIDTPPCKFSRKYIKYMRWFVRDGNIAMKSDNKIELHLKHSVDFIFELTLNSWRFDPSHHHLLQPDIPQFASFSFESLDFHKNIKLLQQAKPPSFISNFFRNFFQRHSKRGLPLEVKIMSCK